MQHRGQPSTHDIPLAISLFDALGSRARDIRIPRYDKSAYNGQGDRAGEEEWEMVNREGEATVEVVVFEGWCVGFRALGDEELERKWEGARREAMEGGDGYVGQLGRLRLEDMRFVNDKLREYDSLTEYGFRFSPFAFLVLCFFAPFCGRRKVWFANGLSSFAAA